MTLDPKNLSTSPDRGIFQLDLARERAAQESDSEKAEDKLRIVELLEEMQGKRGVRETDPEWRKNNLEYDLRTATWICDKARASKSYAQNIYAALCNQEWQKIDVLPILKDESWGCSWRSAGGIVADILGEGDYIDWYCSGMGEKGNGNGHGNDPSKTYVGEGHVTDEIREDFRKLGWQTFGEDDSL